MSYIILTKENIKAYLNSIEITKAYFGEDDLSIDEIGDGNLNYVFIIKSLQDASKALILKQAVPYLRCVGEEYPLSKERMTFEIRALKTFYEEAQAFIPKIYYSSEEMSVVLMQFLGEHIIMRRGMIAQTIYPHFSEHISTYLANNLFNTSSLKLDSTSKRILVDKFNANMQLCKLTEDFVFTFAFMEHETNDSYAKGHTEFAKLSANMDFKKEVLRLKYKFMTQTDALLHGDLHTGSIMLNQNETYVIDPEFAFVGPFGFDIGALIGNLTMSYIAHTALGSAQSYRDWVLGCIEEVLGKFESKFLALWDAQDSSALITPAFIDGAYLKEFKQSFMQGIMKDTAGFAGCKMARRMFGIAGVADIREIDDVKIKDEAIRLALNVATRFVIEHQKITCKEDIMKIIKEEIV